MDIEIIQVTDPWNFLARENPESANSSEAQDFQTMREDMNNYLNQMIDQGTVIHRPVVGEICAAQTREDSQWHRVRIVSVSTQSRKQQAVCHMIDRGSEITVSAQRLMKLPKKFKEFPVQVLHCCLWGVEPVTLVMEPGEMGLESKSRPSDKWDLSAIQYMRRMVDTSVGCQAEIMDRDPEDTLYLRLYFITQKGRVCFNDKLVEEAYALNVETPEVHENLLNHRLQKLSIIKQAGNNNGIVIPSEHSRESHLEHCSPKDMPTLICTHSANNRKAAKMSNQAEDKFYSSELTQNNEKGICKEKDLQERGLWKTDNDTSPEKKTMEPSVQAFFDNAQKYFSSPESKSGSRSDANYKSDQFSARTLSLKSHGAKKGQQPSIPSEVGDGSVTHPYSENQHSFPVLSHNQARLSTTDTSNPAVPGTVMNFILGRGRGLITGETKGRKDACKPGGSLLKNSPVSSSSSSSDSSLSALKFPHRAVTPQVSQSCASLNLGHRSQCLNISDPASWGEGARPKGSKVTFPQEQSIPASASPHNDSESTTTMHNVKLSNQLEPQETNSPSLLSSSQSQAGPLQSDTESVSSVDGGVRARYRRSVDPTVEVKIPDEDRLAEISLSKDVYAQELEGKRLLETLRKRSGKTLPRDPDMHSMNIDRQDLPIPRPIFGVVAHGKSIPTLTCDMLDVPFHDSVKKVLEDKDIFQIDTAHSIQGYVWPAALTCRHIIGVCPPGKGKTMSYIPALISHMLDQTTYIELPQGKGPLAVVLVPSWKKARDVFDLVEKFTTSGLKDFQRIRSVVLYAGGTEDNEHTQIALVRGCEILIATPPSLLRMLDQALTSLKRLCHVVLDDAEILSTRFAKEVDAIMQLYKIVLRDRRYQSVPRQIMIFSTQWHNGIDQFRLRYTKEPVIAIASRVEASVYGNVKQVVTMLRWEQRLTKLCALLDVLASSEHRVAAFTSDLTEALEMWQAAKSRGVYCLLIHEDLPTESIIEARDQWLHSSHSNQLIVMVCTDQCYQDLAITNATMVIHFGLPNSKTKFGNRIACMLDYFEDRTSSVQPEIEPVSHVFLTERCAERAQSLFDILQRCKAKYSSQLKEFIQGHQMTMEEDPRRNLCPLLKSFGVCINQERCENRHRLIPSQDLKTGEISQNSLPSDGEVKIQVLHVVNASRYYCHLVEHRSDQDNMKTNLRLEYQKLTLDMVTFFCKEANHVPYVPSKDPFEDGLCAFKDDENQYYRAKVMEVKDGTRAEPMKQVKVWLVDAGCYSYGTIDQLVKLPKRIADVPYQAVEVYLCSIKPMDNDSEWTDKANLFVHDLLEGKELIGRIMLRVGMTLWLFPLVHRVRLHSVGIANDFSVRQELLKYKYATPHSEHIQQLYELCRGKTEIPEKMMRHYYDYCSEMEMTQETLTGNTEYHPVSIAAVISPGLFYLQKWDSFSELEKLEAQIVEKIQEKEKSSEEEQKLDSSIQLEKGSVCLAKSVDERWYRAKIISDFLDDEWEVFFLDYGDREKVSSAAVKPLPRELGELPCQAIECELAYIKPKDEKWPISALDMMCDLSYYVDGDKKKLFAKVDDGVEASYTIGQRLVVDLHDTTSGDVIFSQELVWRHVAVCSDESSRYENLLGKPALQNQMFFNPLDKIAFLAANIYWCENHEDALKQADELCSLMSLRVRGWDVALEQRGVLPSIVKVVGYIPDTEAHGILLKCLTSCCLDSARLLGVAIAENLDANLVFCLEQVSRPDIQSQAALAVSQLVTLDRFLSAVDSAGYLVPTIERFLNRHQNSSVDLEVLKCLCSASAKLVKSPEGSCCDILRSEEMVDLIFAILKQTMADSEKEPWLEMLAAMATWESTHPHMMRESHVLLALDLLVKCQCVKCLYYLLCVCQSLALGSRKHKKILLEMRLLIILKDLLAAGLRSPALEVCQELHAKMNLQLPQHEALAGVPAQPYRGELKVVAPQVTWSQNCFRLLLTIKVRNAKPEDFVVGGTRVCCRCESEGVLYEFDWELYDSVLPDQTKIIVNASDTIVSLRKETKGQWSRLLKNKGKLPNLRLDFDHIYDSDEEDLDEADNITKLTQQRYRSDGFYKDEIRRVKLEPMESTEESSDQLSSSDHDEPCIDMESLFFRNSADHKT